MSLPLIIVPDCNVLIHGRSLHDLPWEDFGVESIEIRLVGQVVTELDALKNRAGRPSRIARDLSTQLRTLLSVNDRSDVIREAGPRVTRMLWLGRQEAKVPVREGLDLTHGDQAIINQVLAMVDCGRDALLLTDDVLAAALAGEFGAPFKLLPEDWRRPAEQDEAQKEIARLKSENGRLTAAEPKFDGWFGDDEGARIDRVEATLESFEALSVEAVVDLMARIERAAPMANLTRPVETGERKPFDLAELGALHKRPAGSLTAHQIETYEQDYAAWLKGVRSQLERLHLIRAQRQEWPSLTFVAENNGVRPAQHTLVELDVKGDFYIAAPERLNEKELEENDKKRRLERHLALPPRVPMPMRWDRIMSAARGSSHIRDISTLPPPISLSKPREADAFYWRKGRMGPTTAMQLECESWRHKREPEAFAFILGGRDGQPLRGVITATVSAGNVAAPFVLRLPVRLAFEAHCLDSDAEAMVTEFERAMARMARTPPRGPN
ncbi:PIN domain-containing protein [Brevundimonas sp.]|uniref:PIN domain-containing protein n=1 Tax=Brevundimonas sp. TaxID=1871086 RepID=UPI002897185F|nr:PIN domain-containing protein [Brevundimonas sp.]